MQTGKTVELHTGDMVAGRYLIVRKLGVGGMGEVYVAQDITLEKKVAIKLLLSDHVGDLSIVGRFVQEARLAAKIHHENVVDITDVGTGEDGRPYFVMEYLEGQSLTATISATRGIPWGRAQGILRQLCDALAAAHAKSIIHRDIKPENVFLISRTGVPEYVKVLDFGIARGPATDATASKLTRTGTIVGTPNYIAPEAAMSRSPDHRVDIFSIGVTAFEMLTGRVPWEDENPFVVLARVLNDPTPPLNAPGQNWIVPPDVEAVVYKAMAKKPEDRYQTVAELRAALEACAGGLPFGVMPAVTASRLAFSPTLATPVPIRASPLPVLRITTPAPIIRRPAATPVPAPTASLPVQPVQEPSRTSGGIWWVLIALLLAAALAGLNTWKPGLIRGFFHKSTAATTEPAEVTPSPEIAPPPASLPPPVLSTPLPPPQRRKAVRAKPTNPAPVTTPSPDAAGADDDEDEEE